MGLAEKMFSRNPTCSIRSECRKESDKRYFDSLFDDNWEVFVIRRKEADSGFDWFTLCCEAADGTRYGQ